MRMRDVLGLIMGGGRGSRLYPLTRDRSKPAVPLAGKYRLIDIPVSNCFHAGIEKIAILTQFNSASLHRHIYRTYIRDIFASGWVQILAAEQTLRSGDWYQGTADAVRKQVIEIKEARTEYVLVLAGDHLYRMDYRQFVQHHVDSGAEITIAVKPVSREQAPELGILKLDSDRQIVRFTEKPKSDEALAGLESLDDPDKPFLASMGIYVFATDVLFELLEAEGDDFGSEIIPASIGKRRVMGHVFDGYWQDIGTIRGFFEVNLALATTEADFDFYTPDRPIYTRARFLPSSELRNAQLSNVLLTDGCRIRRANISDSVVGLRSIVNEGVEMRRTVLMGADYFETEELRRQNQSQGWPNIGIGEGCVIEGAIIDKNARIGRNVRIRSIPDRPDADAHDWVARDGIVIVPKNAMIPDGTLI